MGNTVDGHIGDVFYCYKSGEEGWYKIVDNHRTIRLDPSEVDPDDIQDPPRLKNWPDYDLIPDSSNGGGYNGKGTRYNDLQTYVSEHTGTGPGGYYTKDDLKAIARGNFDGEGNIPQHVRDQATALLKGGKFNKLAGDDALFHSWNFDEMNSKAAPLPDRKSSAPDLKTLLKDNGNYAKRADIELIANTGTYKGMRVSDDVRNEARNLVANNGKLFNERAGDDGLLAVWDLEGKSSSSAPTSSTPTSSTPASSTPATSTPITGKITNDQSAMGRMVQLYGKNDPTNNLVNDIKSISGSTSEWLKPKDVRKAIDLTDDPAKKELFQWVYDNFGRLDNSKENLPGKGPGLDHGDDGRLGAGDIQAFFGWSGGRGPNPRTDPFPSVPEGFAFQNSSGFTGADLAKIYGNKQSPHDDLINEIKAKAGSDGLWLDKGTVKRVLDTETDPVKKRLYQTIYDNFADIDHVKNRRGGHTEGPGNDGWIGGGDLEKWLGW